MAECEPVVEGCSEASRERATVGEISDALEDVYGRYRAGKNSTGGIDMEEMRERIGRSLDLAELAANRLSYS